MGAVCQNWYSIASVKFLDNRNPYSTSFMRIKKQQEMIGKMGDNLNLCELLSKINKIQQICRLVATLCSLLQ